MKSTLNLEGASLFLSQMRDPDKGQVSLRRGRRSAEGALYFLTMCAAKRKSGLDTPKVFEMGIQIAREMETAEAIEFHCLVVMPDHMHLLIRLRGETRLEDFAKSFKGRLSPLLRKLGAGWERGYFDRLLRDKDPVDVVVRYMVMNPYRKKLLEADEEWPFWYCSSQARTWIDGLKGQEKPIPEWLQR